MISRLNSLRIVGLTEKASEKAKDVAKEVMTFSKNNLKVDLKPQDIDLVRRMGKKTTGVNRPVLLKLVTNSKKWEIYSARMSLNKNGNGKKGKDGIYINEDLPPMQAELYKETRKRLKKVGDFWQKGWTENGRVFVRIVDGGNPLFIKDMKQLDGKLPKGGEAVPAIPSDEEGSSEEEEEEEEENMEDVVEEDG